jgi:hypothetical protein
VTAGRGRFDNLRRIEAADPATDYQMIHRLTLREEFPWDMRMAFNLAFNRSFALPRVAALLARTGRVLDAPRKRADDTGLLMYEILVHGFDDPRARAAVRRINEIHSRFELHHDDSVYVLAALVVVPMRWLDRYGWRRPSPHERTAAALFYRELGRLLGVPDIPDGYPAFAAWFDAYEQTELRHTPAAERIERATRGLLRNRIPKRLRRLADPLISSLYDAPLRTACAVPDPPAWARIGLHLTLRTRARVLRLARPRRVPLFADGITVRSYPDGYEIADLGG